MAERPATDHTLEEGARESLDAATVGGVGQAEGRLVSKVTLEGRLLRQYFTPSLKACYMMG